MTHMKKLITSSFFILSLSIFGQKVDELKFESNVIDSENSYVALAKKENTDKYSYGYIYFDEVAGYSFRSLGDLIVENQYLKLVPNESNKTSIMVARIGNFNLKMAIISKEMALKLKLENPPEWIKFYKNSGTEDEQLLNRASILNGSNFPKLALPILLKLQKKDYKSEKFYFELAFSYNALTNFAEAEKVCLEAIKNKKIDDLLRKEYIYSLAFQNKITEGDAFLSNNLNLFKNNDNKLEAMINLVASSAHHDNIVVAKKWLEKLKNEPNNIKYQKGILQLEGVINKKNQK